VLIHIVGGDVVVSDRSAIGDGALGNHVSSHLNMEPKTLGFDLDITEVKSCLILDGNVAGYLASYKRVLLLCGLHLPLPEAGVFKYYCIRNETTWHCSVGHCEVIVNDFESVRLLQFV
jgi:hypothetical protein